MIRSFLKVWKEGLKNDFFKSLELRFAWCKDGVAIAPPETPNRVIRAKCPKRVRHHVQG